MVAYTQAHRQLAIETSLGEDTLLLTSFTGQEEISKPFCFHLELLSQDDALSPASIVGQMVTVSIQRGDGDPRYFNGFVRRFHTGSYEQTMRRYRAEVVPRMWFLSQSSDCRIFQEMTVPEILEQVFTRAGLTDYVLSGVSGFHPKHTYCVQYRETDMNFASRLMESEGIFYTFRHARGAHTLVLADKNAAYQPCVESEVEFPQTFSSVDRKDRITSWEHRYDFRPGQWPHNDFNFESPSAPMLSNVGTVIDMPGVDKFERYDYPGHTAHLDGLCFANDDGWQAARAQLDAGGAEGVPASDQVVDCCSPRAECLPSSPAP